MSKTNPVQKAKAADLLSGVSPIAIPSSPQKSFNGTGQRFNNVKSSGYGMNAKVNPQGNPA